MDNWLFPMSRIFYEGMEKIIAANGTMILQYTYFL